MSMKNKKMAETILAVAIPALIFILLAVIALAAWQPHNGTGIPVTPTAETVRETAETQGSRPEVNPVLVIETQGQESETGE